MEIVDLVPTKVELKQSVISSLVKGKDLKRKARKDIIVIKMSLISKANELMMMLMKMSLRFLKILRNDKR